MLAKLHLIVEQNQREEGAQNERLVRMTPKELWSAGACSLCPERVFPFEHFSLRTNECSRSLSDKRLT